MDKAKIAAILSVVLGAIIALLRAFGYDVKV
jgi:hypothetical protein